MIFTNYRFMDYEKKHRHTVTRHTFSQSPFFFLLVIFIYCHSKITTYFCSRIR